jgi:hypothetical protein
MKSIGVLLAVVLLGLLGGPGCASNKPGSSSHAYLEIKNQTQADIVKATMAVFQADGYTLSADQPGMLAFTRPASRRDVLKYGDWLNDGMLMQVKVRFTDLGDNTMLLQADVYSVQDPKDAFFRSETRVAMVDRHPYQEMLNQVRDRLEKPQ